MSDCSNKMALNSEQMSQSISGAGTWRILYAQSARPVRATLGHSGGARLRGMLRRPGYGKCVEDAATNEHLSTRQKLALVVGTPLKAETLFEMADESIDFDFLKTNDVSASVLKAAQFSVAQLKQRGVDTPQKLAALGFTTLHLLDPAFCTECVDAYGADNVLTEFFVSANDAVLLSGSQAVTQLGLDVGLLLLLCAGQPHAAKEVLSQCHPTSEALRNVPPLTLIETGLNATQLSQLGFTAAQVREQTRASYEQLHVMGF